LPVACATFLYSIAHVVQFIRSSVVNDFMTGLNASPVHFKDWMQH
jgi:hypothetical protein